MTSFHTNLAFDQEWATPGEPLYVNGLSHAMLSCRAAFHESTPFAFFTPLKCTDRCGKPQFPHRTGSFFTGRFSGESTSQCLSQYEKREDFCS